MHKFPSPWSITLVTSLVFSVYGCAEKKEPAPEPTSGTHAAEAEDTPAQETGEDEVPADENPNASAEEGSAEEGSAEAADDGNGEEGSGEEEVAREDQSDLKCEDEDVVCPLYEFQEENAYTAVENRDTDAVAKVLHQIEFFAPDPSWNEPPNGWAQIARRGAIAAEAGNLREARKACRECHRLFPNEDMPFRKMYETQGYRTRPLPELPEDAETSGLPDLVMEAS